MVFSKIWVDSYFIFFKFFFSIIADRLINNRILSISFISFIRNEEQALEEFMLKEGQEVLAKRNDLMSTNKKKMNYTSQVQGKLFEYVVYKWLNNERSNSTIQCGRLINKEEIDCYCLTDTKFEHYECKLTLHDLKEVIMQIKRKRAKIGEIYKGYEIIDNIVIYQPISNNKKEEFEKNKIRVYPDFENTIMKNNSIYDGNRRDLKRLLSTPSNRLVRTSVE